MNAYLEPAYPVLMTAIASPDKTFGLWLQESSLAYAVGMPIALSLTAAGGALMGAKLLRVHFARQKGRRTKNPAQFVEAIAHKPYALCITLAGGLLAGVLSYSSLGPTKLAGSSVMPTWHKPTASQVLQALTGCEYWVAPVGEGNRYTCPVDFGQDWQHFAVKAPSAAPKKFFGGSEPTQSVALRSVTIEQMEMLVSTAKHLSSMFKARECYMPAHPAAHVFCPSVEGSVPLTEWAIQSNPGAWGHRTCGFGKTYVHTGQQHLEPSIKDSLAAPALVRYVMPRVVACGGDGVKVEELGAWLSAGIRAGTETHVPAAGPSTGEAVAIASYR